MAEQIELLEMKGITKSFPGVIACDSVDLELRSGEVLALLGENGAGKSSLMNILYGLYKQDKGQILVNGREVVLDSPLQAFKIGIGMVHQHFMLVPNLTVVENVALGMCHEHAFALDLNGVRRSILEVSRTYGLAVHPDALVWQLSVGEQQRVELVKVLTLGANLLIMDEPTAALTPQETDELLDLLRDMAKRGCSVIFISHKLNEVRKVSDRVMVLRGGKRVYAGPTRELSDAELAERMAGRELGQPLTRQTQSLGDSVALSVVNIHANNDRGLKALNGVSFDVRKGEIFGLAGVSGNGQRELAEVLNGLRKVEEGNIFIESDDITNHAPLRLIEEGLGYIPENRMHEGTIATFSVRENLILKDYDTEKISKRGFLSKKKTTSFASRLISAFKIKTPDMETNCASLSGGNIQKVILAREITRDPKVLVAVYPIRGLDLGAAENVHERLLNISAIGAAVLLISEELDELLALCDRIAVIYEGRIMKVLDARKTNKQELGLLMAGVDDDAGVLEKGAGVASEKDSPELAEVSS
ncbi:MAG: ABC transporter ATP-binding protein [Synergistaceae bacterium]|jgi:simple sugar transport system ATP-binding protein|nr:ABC transporter ATP-binding protein [Synergistaceae bacterium]